MNPATEPVYPAGSGVVTWRDDGVKVWRVQWAGRMCSPTWTERGPALAYMAMLADGRRKPEFAGDFAAPPIKPRWGEGA